MSSHVLYRSNNVQQDVEIQKPEEMKLLDLFSGCGAMSTGLCLGANMSGVPLVTKWAVDLNQYACQSLSHNHPETEVRNEKAEEFLALLKEWERLCAMFSLIGDKGPQQQISPPEMDNDEDDEEEEAADNVEIFEVEKILSICYGVPVGQTKAGLYFKIRWKGYGEDEDTWEPEYGLCVEKGQSKVVVKRHRHEVMFIAFCKRSMVLSEALYEEKRVFVQVIIHMHIGDQEITLIPS